VGLVEIVVVLVRVIVVTIVIRVIVSKLIGRTFLSTVISNTRAQPQWFWVKLATHQFAIIVTSRVTLSKTVLNIKTMFKMVEFKVVGMVVVLIVVDRLDEMVEGMAVGMF
jgi:hypothetical protein